MTTKVINRQLQQGCADLITTAYEAGYLGTGSWATGSGYTWSDTEATCSVTLYEMLDEEGYEGKTFDASEGMYINETIVMEWITKACTTGIEYADDVPTYARLGKTYMTEVVALYHDLDADFDAISADAVLQTILLGRLVYG